MSRTLPEYQIGHYYHLYNRGANKGEIFFEEKNYHFLLKKVKKYTSSLSISLIAYCLMPNHYHFLIRQDGNYTAGTFIQRIFNSYSKAVNKQYGREGTLFEGPYRAIHVDDRNYLIHLCRYIHRNPLEAHLVKNINDWPYSNYLEWINARKGSLYNPDLLQHYFSSPEEYKQFVDDYKSPQKIEQYLFE
ncbi:transposase [Fodinibius salsisoli]|uniref:Transposase n=1 Tax=Fodinibius salsisoli TaxID=2820877 RepID=A0ABT3PQT0_9BACT|nr:transposase [Fodinibius salsisoli]MCW9708228.1 transposase [Fodinibius salsisoli]